MFCVFWQNYEKVFQSRSQRVLNARKLPKSMHLESTTIWYDRLAKSVCSSSERPWFLVFFFFFALLFGCNRQTTPMMPFQKWPTAKKKWEFDFYKKYITEFHSHVIHFASKIYEYSDFSISNWNNDHNVCIFWSIHGFEPARSPFYKNIWCIHSSSCFEMHLIHFFCYSIKTNHNSSFLLARLTLQVWIFVYIYIIIWIPNFWDKSQNILLNFGGSSCFAV